MWGLSPSVLSVTNIWLKINLLYPVLQNAVGYKDWCLHLQFSLVMSFAERLARVLLNKTKRSSF